MVIYAINGDDVLYSNMDGGGTPFNDGDSWSVITGSILADQNGKAGANCTINANGVFTVEPDVNALFNSGGAWKLIGNQGGWFFCLGTVGHNAVIGGDVGQDCNEFTFTNGCAVYCEYTNVGYFSNGNGWSFTSSANAFFRNCTFTAFSTTVIRLYYGRLEFDSCDSGNDASLYFVYCLYSGEIIYKDNTIRTTAGGEWLNSLRQAVVTFIGNNTINIAGAGAVPMDETNDLVGATAHVIYSYYPKLVLSEGNNLAGCDVTVNHPSQDSDGRVVATDASGDADVYFEAFKSYPQGDGSGDVDLYLLKEVLVIEDNITYFSDSGEAEAGDNQKFTIGLIKDGYLYGITTAWADGGTASITLSEAAGGRSPKERRHGV